MADMDERVADFLECARYGEEAEAVEHLQAGGEIPQPTPSPV